jgi:hypothetical protein
MLPELLERRGEGCGKRGLLQEPGERSATYRACEALGDNMEAIGVVSPAYTDEVS